MAMVDSVLGEFGCSNKKWRVVAPWIQILDDCPSLVYIPYAGSDVHYFVILFRSHFTVV